MRMQALCLIGNAGENPEQSRYCKWSLRNYVTDESWEDAEGDEAKPGDLPVARLYILTGDR